MLSPPTARRCRSLLAALAAARGNGAARLHRSGWCVDARGFPPPLPLVRCCRRHPRRFVLLGRPLPLLPADDPETKTYVCTRIVCTQDSQSHFLRLVYLDMDELRKVVLLQRLSDGLKATQGQGKVLLPPGH